MNLRKTVLSTALLLGLSTAAMAEDWSGFYIGPQVSYNWMNTTWQGLSSSFNPTGFSVGLHAGWAFQMDNWVFGIDGSYSGGSYSAQVEDYKTKVSQVFTLTPVVGYTQDAWLFYGKAGYVSGNVEADIYDNGANIWNDSERQYGWTAGLGVSYQMDAQNSVGLEYDYSHLGGTEFNSTTGDVVGQVNVNPINMNSISLNYTRHFG